MYIIFQCFIAIEAKLTGQQWKKILKLAVAEFEFSFWTW